MNDNKLKYLANAEMIGKRAQQRLYCLCKLSKFNVDKTLISLFYKSYIESILTCSIICWHGNLSVKAKNALSRIVKVSSKIVGTEQSSLTDLYNRQVVRKANSILWASDHPLYSEFEFLPSGLRLRFPLVKRSNHYRCSFILTAIFMLVMVMVSG